MKGSGFGDKIGVGGEVGVMMLKFWWVGGVRRMECLGMG